MQIRHHCLQCMMGRFVYSTQQQAFGPESQHMHRSLDSRSSGKPQSVFIYGKTSLEKIASKRRERERAHFFFLSVFFFQPEREVHEQMSATVTFLQRSSSSLQKVSIVRHFLETDMLSSSVTIRYSVPRKTHDLANKKALHTSTFLFGSTLAGFTCIK